ncbi:hypothetical protein [Streptomyces sp. ST2-7A]|uniref:hypothetical protein n=1 Tax=Streptomyces sp. ST2-7A TaxID=2907214 RepID=UPI001F1D32C6|nr:hypothetical protein [Streptomyces sp. ST2-7A]MCE7080062.1 hypothetical protein [Streptomyces sp. ST2-7A]
MEITEKPMRPTTRWRDRLARQPELYPTELLEAADAVLDAFDSEVAALGDAPSDAEVVARVERVVTAFNDLDERHGFIETIEREELCDHIDAVLTARGVDVEALAGRAGIGRWELTDAWRDW